MSNKDLFQKAKISATKIRNKRLQSLFQNDIRIFSEPKTASTTIQYMINSVWHHHYAYLPSFINITNPPNLFIRRRNIILTRILIILFKLSCFFSKKKIKIITCIRNPSDRVASQFFFNLEYHLYISRKNNPSSIVNLDINHDEMIEHLFNRNIDLWKKIYESYDYFDDEIKKLTGIDVYKYKFDQSKGFRIYKGKFSELMVIESSKINILKKEISDFAECQINERLEEKNSSNNKWYSDIYRRIYTSQKRDKTRAMFKNTKYARHFYED